MGAMSIGHWIVILIIVVLIFGTKKLGGIGQDLGKAVKGFKDGMKGEEETKADAPAVKDGTTVDVDAKEKK